MINYIDNYVSSTNSFSHCYLKLHSYPCDIILRMLQTYLSPHIVD